MLARFVRMIRSLWRRDRLEREISTEIAFHLEMEAAELSRQGLDPVEARRVARRNFNGVDRVAEEIRDARGLNLWDGLVQDLRYGLRTLAKSPGYTVVAVVTLTLGIGANTAIFSVIDGVLLKPLPYRDGAGLVLVKEAAPLRGQNDVGVSIKEVRDYRDELQTFQDVVEYHSMSFTLLSHGEPDRVDTGVVSANFFDVLGVKALVGRIFVKGDDVLGAPPVLVLGYGYWQRKFGGDPAIVGQVVQMNDKPHTIVGVLPDIPQYPRENDVYMPTSACPFRAAGERRMNENRRAFSALEVFGRLRPGVTPGQAEADVERVAARWRRDFPGVYQPDTTGFTARAIGLQAALTSGARDLLLVLMGATGLVLLIACANVANLTLARMLRRERELAVRTALGAGRGRLLRQLLTESTLIAAAGAAIGVALAASSIGLLTSFVGRFTTRTGQIEIDGGVLLFTLVMAVATGLAFGALPALSARRTLVASLKEGGAAAGDGRGRHRMRSTLVLAQVSVSFVLLAGAGLLLASFFRLSRVDLGFQPEQVMTAEIFGNWSRQTRPVEIRRFNAAVLGRLGSAPGVRAAALTNAVPLAQIFPAKQTFRVEGHTAAGGQGLEADQNLASPDYFVTLGVALVRGRAFTASDGPDAPKVAVINQAMARAWDGADPVGTRFTLDDGDTWITVTGVVGDVRLYGLDQPAGPVFFTPLAQAQGGSSGGRVLVRAAGDPAAIAALITDAVHRADPQVPVENLQTLATLKSGRLAAPRLTALLLAIFAGLALVITVAGLSGVIATSVSQRTHEFGVRMALGASRGAVLPMVVGGGLALVGLGLALGLAGALGLSRVLTSYLFDTAPTDPVTLAVVAAVFLAAALAACLGPARRATAIDPVIALRAE